MVMSSVGFYTKLSWGLDYTKLVFREPQVRVIPQIGVKVPTYTLLMPFANC